MSFAIIGHLTDIEVIAAGRSVRQRRRLIRRYGGRRWRKLKGIALVRLAGGIVQRAEVHWYEAHGIGRVRFKIKRVLH